MRRRTILGAVGGGIATGLSGCTGTSNRGGSNPSNTPTIGQEARRARISGQDDVPTNAEFEFRTEVLTPTVTEEHTATIQVVFENKGRKRTFTFGSVAPFTETNSVEGDPGVLLLPTNRHYNKPAPNCWRPPRTSHAGATNASAHQIDLERGEVIKHNANVWGSELNEDNGVCIPTGEFRFENQYNFEIETISQFTWGFTLSLAGVG